MAPALSPNSPAGYLTPASPLPRPGRSPPRLGGGVVLTDIQTPAFDPSTPIPTTDPGSSHSTPYPDFPPSGSCWPQADPGSLNTPLPGGGGEGGKKGERARGVARARARPIIAQTPNISFPPLLSGKIPWPRAQLPACELRLGRGQNWEAGVGIVNGNLGL